MSHKFYYKFTFFEIKNGKAGPTVDKYFNTGSEVRRFIITKSATLADYVVFDLHNNKCVTSTFKQRSDNE